MAYGSSLTGTEFYLLTVPDTFIHIYARGWYEADAAAVLKMLKDETEFTSYFKQQKKRNTATSNTTCNYVANRS